MFFIIQFDSFRLIRFNYSQSESEIKIVKRLIINYFYEDKWEGGFAMEELKMELWKAIGEDNLGEVISILQEDKTLQDEFNTTFNFPFLHHAVEKNSKRTFEYLISQPFVDIYQSNLEIQRNNIYGGNILHEICASREKAELFAILTSKLSHSTINSMLKKSTWDLMTPFQYTCKVQKLENCKELIEEFNADVSFSTSDKKLKR